MKSDLWIKEIMSLKVPNISQKDVTKILILFYLIEYRKLNSVINIYDLSKYVYEFYIDNPDISKFNSNSVIRNICRYNIDDIIQVVKIAIYDWKNDFPNGCLSFIDNELITDVTDANERTYSNSMMIAKMLYKKATMNEWNYCPDLLELHDIKIYNLEYLNKTRLKNRVLEDINYCCCCDKLENLNIINISDDKKFISNPKNYVTVCHEHYELFINGYYTFLENGKIKIKKNHFLINKNMHISQKIMSSRSKEIE